MRLIAHIDGGVDGQGEAYVGVTMADADTGEVVAEHGIGIGQGTVNEAEYSALLLALYQAEEFLAIELTIKSDSKLVVNQMNGSWAIHKNHLREYANEAKTILGRMRHGALKTFSLQWVRRTENVEADRLTRVPRPRR